MIVRADAIAAFVVVAGVLATGCLARRLVRADADSVALRLAFTTTLGLALTMAALYAPLALGGAVAFDAVAAAHLAAIAVVAIEFLVRARRGAAVTRTGFGVGALVFLGALAFADTSAARPYHAYDAKAIYGVKARALFVERGVTGPIFADPDVVHYHADYPLGVPLLAAYTGSLSARIDATPLGSSRTPSERARGDAVVAYVPVTALWAVAYLALVAGAIGVLARDRRLAWLTPLVIPAALVLPYDVGASWRTTPELPLAVCLGVVALAPATRTRGAAWWAGAAAAGAVLLKDDAWIALGCLLLAAVAFGVRAGARRVSPAAVAVAVPPALAAVAVAAVRARLPDSPFDEDYLAALLRADVGAWLVRLAALPRAVVETLWATDGLAFWALAFGVGVPLARRAPHRRWIAAAVVLHALATLAVFVVTPDHSFWQVRTALARVWAQMSAPAAVLVALGLERVWMFARDANAPGGRVHAPTPRADASAASASAGAVTTLLVARQ